MLKERVWFLYFVPIVETFKLDVEFLDMRYSKRL
jgi:hypothetical protein